MAAGFGDVLATGFADVCLFFLSFSLVVVGLMSVGIVGFVIDVVVVVVVEVAVVGAGSMAACVGGVG